jgi:hypothetical protein
VFLEAPLDVRLPDILTPPIVWHPDHPTVAERFGITKVRLEILGQFHEAWIYVAELSPHRFNHTMVEVVARPIDGVRHGLACTLHIDRVRQILVI